MAGELYASLDDINVHLPPGKAEIDDADDDLLQIEVYRFIRSKLAGSFATTTLAGWNSPTATPGIVRSIAGMLIAAKWYAELYAEDMEADAAYARNLYNTAMGLLNDIVTGNITVLDSSGVEVPNTSMLGVDSFWPNDDAPVFTMDKAFG